MSSIHAILVTYQEGDERDLLTELAGWCPVPDSLSRASLMRRVEWLAARVALKRLLALLSLKFVLAPESEAPYPRLRDALTQGCSSVSVSWAHTGDCAVVGVSGLPLGIDVEPTDRNVSKVLLRIASLEEISRTQKIQSHQKQPVPPALALWCGKEAMAKATGLGMKWGLKNFEFLSQKEGGWLIQIHQEGPRKIPDAAVSLVLRDRWLIAFAGSHSQLLNGPVWH